MRADMGESRRDTAIDTSGAVPLFQLFPERLEDLSPHTQDPIGQYRKASSPRYKRAAYHFLRPALDLSVRRYLGRDFLRQVPNLVRVLPERGLPLEDRRNWINRQCPLRDKRILLLGAGNGWEVLSWARYKPARLVALDLYPFFESWRLVQAESMNSRLGAPDFLLASLDELPVASESMDLAVSDAVFEHCKDMAAVLRELHRVLRPGGFIYATYGPMWFCFGGDHFSGRGGLTHGYSHIELSAGAYKDYFEAQKKPEEDAQSGGRYVELDLFSKLTTGQYFQLYEQQGFRPVETILEISANAIEFRKRWPERFNKLLRSYPGTSPEDLLVKANFVILEKRR